MGQSEQKQIGWFVMWREERRRWTRRPVRPEKVYSELDPVALQAAVDIAEKLHRGHINPPAVSCAIKEYLRVLVES